MTVRELCELCEKVFGPKSIWGDEFVFTTGIDGNPFLSLRGPQTATARPYQRSKVREALRMLDAMNKGTK